MPTVVNKETFLKKLFLNGHFWNKQNPDTLNVKQSDLSKLDLSHKLVKQAVGSWQSLDINFDNISAIVHRRQISTDGDIGPVTAAMADVDRCAMPDHPPPPNASFQYDDPDLQAAVVSMQQFCEHESIGATGSGSFPVPGCDPLRKNRQSEHSIVVNVNISNCPASTLAKIDDIITFCRKCAAEFGLAARYVKGGAKGPTHYFDYQSIPGSVIGYNYFPTPGTCNQTVMGKLDTGFQAATIIEAGLWVHEHQGHGTGLNHTRGGIMNASINNINPLSWRGDPSESTVKRYFSGVAVSVDDDVVPPTPTPSQHPEIIGSLRAETFSGGIAIRGEQTVNIKAGQSAGNYSYIAVPDQVSGYKFVPKPVV